MTWLTRSGRPLPPAITGQAAGMAADPVNRREFLALASSFGASTATAYAMLGLAQPARAQAADANAAPSERTDVRIQMEVRPLADPRTFDWFQAANVTRGWLEYLVSYENDGTFRPQLLEAWEISEDAQHYTLHLRPGVTWNDGAPFTAGDVAHNIARWCDRTVPANSMAGRFAVLVDPETDRLLHGAVETIDAHTVALHLPRPDISLIAGMADYPAAIVPRGFDPETMMENPVGTGPYLPERVEPRRGAVLVRNDAHDWWNAGNGAWMERIEFIDLGTDPASYAAAALAGQIDMTHSVEGEFIDVFDAMEGWVQNTVITAATIVIRGNQKAEIDGRKPYADQRVRRALQLAMSNAILLELGYNDRGELAENHHVSPLHPAYAPMPPPVLDPAAAKALMEEAGFADFEHELVSLDDNWRRNTADAAAALLTDAGIKVRRKIVPGVDFWANWVRYPFSTTDWGHRPLGVQTYALAYRSGEPWNEFGWSNPRFDALLEDALATLDIDKRRAIMAELEALVREDAVTVQPYWRRLFNHTVEGLQGGGHNIAFEIRPAELRWSQAGRKGP
ncbi:ABC transporter substrate-binding protein [Roseovarius spongiae]|uniref:ABC transporter substrate-binding protein n=1 Tax=Roseovarius spongiae TaxID=2320272 RepID=A0A3A8AZZ4_9RHOB|nr:ABC transporter substrate-binding protein [Roseovarius spongiae]RKF16670.1 ABC transporter substrate-binding protein [Roseovarius spongiae]